MSGACVIVYKSEVCVKLAFFYVVFVVRYGLFDHIYMYRARGFFISFEKRLFTIPFIAILFFGTI